MCKIHALYSARPLKPIIERKGFNRATYEGLSMKGQRTAVTMRHPQDDLLIVHALVQLAQENGRTPTENHAIELANEIANQHGLAPCEVPAQLEERSKPDHWG